MVKIVSDFLPSQIFAIHHSLTTVSLDTIVSEAVTASVHKHVLLHTVFQKTVLLKMHKDNKQGLQE
jgi:hypothetical protein